MARSTTAMTLLVALVALSAATGVSAALEMHGSGTSNPSKFFWKVMDILEERAKEPISMTYRSVGAFRARATHESARRVASFPSINSLDARRDLHPIDRRSPTRLPTLSLSNVQAPVVARATSPPTATTSAPATFPSKAMIGPPPRTVPAGTFSTSPSSSAASPSSTTSPAFRRSTSTRAPCLASSSAKSPAGTTLRSRRSTPASTSTSPSPSSAARAAPPPRVSSPST